uniref:Uncharacterized protein n=1 Tax=Anguilla anguilla TaxID=7936 RepID=A0A0E9UHQ9_ANGAN
MTHHTADVTMACPDGLPGPVSQVEGNCWTWGGFFTNNWDSPTHQNGLSPNKIHFKTRLSHSEMTVTQTTAIPVRLLR